MILNMYAIRDAKTTFMTPTIDQNDASAMRNFVHAMRNPETLMNSHPQDYSLYLLAQYDTESGKILPLDPPGPINIMNGGLEHVT